ncbi:MAG: hypothetical protein WB341_17600 [Terracidiphilus sp.]
MMHWKTAGCLAILVLPLAAGTVSAQSGSLKASKDLKIVMVDVRRLKLIKRSMYGRAKFDLLRLRVLHAA